ncbi:MAG TPA: sulfite exporter TauE/SafE family protein [Gaiellaceae bacterium]|nr:sulfite exporter TauE/SafE family protein [Gaiellaceae bacterium]
MTWQFVVAGLAVGVLVGMTGMGAGSLMTPILIFVFGFNPATAIGTDILHGAVFKSVGGIRHYKLGTVQAKLSGWMFLGSAPASLLGVALASYLKRTYGSGVQSTEGYVLGGALLLGALGMLAKSVIRVREAPDEPFVLRGRDKVAAVLIGLAGGFIVGLTSVGSGVFFGLTMLIVFPLRAHKVVGTDILHAAGLLWVAGIGHFIAGNVDLHAVGWLLIGSIPGVLAGSQFSIHVGDRMLRILLSLVLFASGAKLVDPNGNSWIAVAGAYVVFTAATLGAVRLRDNLRIASVARID